MLFGQLLNCPDTFWIVRTVSRLSGQFLCCPESFWIIWSVSRLSGQFVDSPDSFLTIRTVSLPTGQFWENICLVAKTFRICKNFPDSNATTLPWFFWLWCYHKDNRQYLVLFRLRWRSYRNCLYGVLRLRCCFCWIMPWNPISFASTNSVQGQKITYKMFCLPQNHPPNVWKWSHGSQWEL